MPAHGPQRQDASGGPLFALVSTESETGPVPADLSAAMCEAGAQDVTSAKARSIPVGAVADSDVNRHVVNEIPDGRFIVPAGCRPGGGSPMSTERAILFVQIMLTGQERDGEEMTERIMEIDLGSEPRFTDFALEWVRRKVDAGALPSAVVGVATSSEVRVLEAFGGAPSGVDTPYALFSISKPLVALAALQQVERGRLSLRAPLADAVPGFGVRRSDSVLLEHLLSHRAGIVDSPLDDLRPLADQLLQAPQDFEAGTMLRYCSIAFQGVAAQVERAGSGSVQDLVGLWDGITFAAQPDAPEVFGGAAVGLDVGAMQRQPHPGAGAYGTATGLLDLGVRLLRCLREGERSLVHPVTLRAMLESRTVGVPEPMRPGPRRDYGLGFLISAFPGRLEHRAFGHSGMSGTQWWIYPDHDLVVVLLTNRLDLTDGGVDVDEFLNAAITDHGVIGPA